MLNSVILLCLINETNWEGKKTGKNNKPGTKKRRRSQWGN